MTEFAALPSGSVTLLFTDIEQSSEKWDLHAAAMRTALAHHDQMLRSAILGHQGWVVKHKGDGFFAAFQSATDALDAVLEAQQAIDTTTWGAEIGPLRVRMALHSGFVEPVGQDYYGPEVNKVARLEGVAHGGQVLLSSATAFELDGRLPVAVDLEDLGSYRLRSLAREDRIFQLVAPGLATDFPPLRTESFDRRALPGYRTSFVGRDRELDDMTELLGGADCRLLTLVGSGGTGKTRLAVEGVRRLVAGRPHGAAFVPLAAVQDPADLISAIAGALDFTFDLHGLAMIDHQTQLVDYLATQNLILILDNFEQLMAASRLVTELVRDTPHVDVVVTSRQRLNVEGEWVLEVGGMDLEPGSEGLSAAVELFLARAHQANPGFHPDPDELHVIASICRTVEGLPLGIELAAPWVSLLSCEEIGRQIERNLDFLKREGADTGGRHQSLRAVFDSSWSMLAEHQQVAFRRLSVFPAPFAIDAAEAVASASIRTLMELRSRSLLRQMADGDLQLHPLLRQYAIELVAETEAEQLRTDHGEFYVNRLLVRDTDLRGGPRQLDAAAELADEHDNLRQAVEWAVATLPDDQVVPILGAMNQFYLNTGWYEGREQFARLVDLLDPIGSDATIPFLWAAAYLAVFEAALSRIDQGEALLARILPEWERLGGSGWAACRYSQGVLAAERGDYPVAEAHLASALEVARQADDTFLIGTTLLWYGWVIAERGDPEGGRRLFDECLQVMSNPTNHWGRAFALSKLGVAADGMGDHERAVEFHQESHEMFEKTNDVAGQAYTLSRLSVSCWLMEDFLRAHEYGLAGLDLFEQLNHRWGVSASLCRVAFAEVSLGLRESATTRLLTALSASEETGFLTLTLYALVGFGALLTDESKDEPAAEILSYAAGHPSLPAPYLDFIEPPLGSLRARMAAGAFGEAQARGAAADLAATLSLARAAVRYPSRMP